MPGGAYPADHETLMAKGWNWASPVVYVRLMRAPPRQCSVISETDKESKPIVGERGCQMQPYDVVPSSCELLIDERNIIVECCWVAAIDRKRGYNGEKLVLRAAHCA